MIRALHSFLRRRAVQARPNGTASLPFDGVAGRSRRLAHRHGGSRPVRPAFRATSLRPWELAQAIVAHPVTPPAGREVLCQGVLSQIALAEGGLAEAGDMASRALEVAHRHGFDRHYFAFHGAGAPPLCSLSSAATGNRRPV